MNRSKGSIGPVRQQLPISLFVRRPRSLQSTLHLPLPRVRSSQLRLLPSRISSTNRVSSPPQSSTIQFFSHNPNLKYPQTEKFFNEKSGCLRPVVGVQISKNLSPPSQRKSSPTRAPSTNSPPISLSKASNLTVVQNVPRRKNSSVSIIKLANDDCFKRRHQMVLKSCLRHQQLAIRSSSSTEEDEEQVKRVMGDGTIVEGHQQVCRQHSVRSTKVPRRPRSPQSPRSIRSLGSPPSSSTESISPQSSRHWWWMSSKLTFGRIIMAILLLITLFWIIVILFFAISNYLHFREQSAIITKMRDQSNMKRIHIINLQHQAHLSTSASVHSQVAAPP